MEDLKQHQLLEAYSICTASSLKRQNTKVPNILYDGPPELQGCYNNIILMNPEGSLELLALNLSSSNRNIVIYVYEFGIQNNTSGQPRTPRIQR
jgi:hypothetical protein